MKFKDLLQKQDGITKGPFGSAVKKALFVPKGHNTYKVYEQGVVATGDFAQGNYYLDGDYVNQKLKRFFIQPGDILITGAGTLGKLQEVPNGIEPGIMNQALIRLRLNKEVVDSRYFAYFFPAWILPVASRINGDSVIPNLPPTEDIKDIDIVLPSLQEQKVIARVLGTIDDKITNNKKLITELEGTARLIYDYWFTQFDFPDENGNPYRSSGGKMVWNDDLKRAIPEGWEIGYLSQLFDVTMGQSPSGESYNLVGDGMVFYQGKTDFGDFFPTARMFTTKPRRTAKGNEVLLSVRAPVGAMNFAYEDCCIGRGLAAISREKTSPLYIRNALSAFESFFTIINNGGTTFGAIDKEFFSSMKTTLPPNEIITQYSKATNSIYLKMLITEKEIRALLKLREWLLPMLMNSQVTVGE